MVLVTSTLLSLFRSWRVALLLVAGVVLLPERGSASECGSHVIVLNPTAESRHDSMPLPATSGGEPVKPPCNGPNCSGAPDRHAPPAPPVPTIGGQVKELVTAAGLPARDDPGRGSEANASHDAHPIHRSLSIFIPPRGPAASL